MPISDPADPRVAAYRDVRDPALVRSQGLFVAEGRLVVRRVIEDGRFVLRSLLVNGAALADLGPLLERIDPAVPIYVCETGDFLGITGFHVHRGCLALVEQPAPLTIAQALSTATTAIVLEDVTNPDNVGGVFRNAAAFGAGAVILSPGCCEPLYRKAVRTSMGATLRVPFARADDWPVALTAIRASGFTIAALTPREPAQSIHEWRPSPQERLALLVGAEGTGLSAAAESIADVRLRIPISDAVDSLNLAVAVGIALFALRRV